MRSLAGVLNLFFVLTIAGAVLERAQAAETVWSGLVIAENVAAARTDSAGIDRIERTLKKFFGYNQFQVIGQSRKDAQDRPGRLACYEQIFRLHVDAQGETEAGYVLNLKLYKEKELLLETDTKLSKRSPLVIKGPAGRRRTIACSCWWCSTTQGATQTHSRIGRLAA